MMEILKNAVWIITTIILPVSGYFVGKYKKIMDNNEVQNQAIKMLLQNNLTNIAYVYLEMGTIPDYVYKGWLNQFHIYKNLGGNDYCDKLSERMEKLKITHTDILK